MKILKPALFLSILAYGLLLTACPGPKLEGRKFWAVNFKTERYYQVSAEKIAEGRRCEIWAENSSGISVSTANELASEYDSKIYPMMISKFSEENIVFADPSLSILDDYSTVYLFFQWLYIQSNHDPALFKIIISSPLRDYCAVTEAAKNINSGWSDWDSLLRTWLAANYIQSPTGIYGYKNDAKLKQLKIRAIGPSPDIGINSYGGNYGLELYPGEGVYSKGPSNYSPPADSGAHIKYARLNDSGMGNVNTSAPFSGTMLLTFNASTENGMGTAYNETAAPERGYLSGANGDTWPRPSASRQMGDFPYSLQIDARDIRPFAAGYKKQPKESVKKYDEEN